MSVFLRSAVPASNPELIAMVRDVAKRYGRKAFEMPKFDAAIHEAGHAVLFAAEGEPVRRITLIARRYENRLHWGGETDASGPWTASAMSDPRSDLRRARFMLAGIIAEIIYHQENHRKGSSLDEVVGARQVCAIAGRKLDKDPLDLFADQFSKTTAALKGLWPETLRLATAVHKHGTVEGRRLEHHLEAVRATV